MNLRKWLTSLLKQPETANRGKAITPRGNTKLEMECLEERTVPTVNFSLSGQTLTVTGDSWNNSLTAQYYSSTRDIKFTSYSAPQSGVGTPVQFTKTYSASSVTYFKFYGNEGNDTLILNFGNHRCDSFASGGSGNDRLEGSDLGNDEFWGGSGNDTLMGYGGVDKLYGESGDDNLIGGPGDDFLAGGAGFDKFSDDFSKTKWVNSFDAKDIQQEASPICTIASAIASAAVNTDLTEDFKYLGNNVYQVRLVKSGNFNYQKITFDGSWNDNDLRPTEYRNSNGEKTGQLNGEYWTLLYARAYLQLNGVNWKDTNTNNWGTSWQSHTKALYAMTGWTTTSETISTNQSTDTAKWIRTHLLDKDAMTIGGTGHAYSIYESRTYNGSWFLTLYNPWGYDDVHQASLNYNNDGKNDGFLTISWKEICENFKYVYLANS